MENKNEKAIQKKDILKAILERRRNFNVDNSIKLLERKDGENHFISSYEQKRLWYIYKLNPNNIAYNIHCGFRIYGELKVDLLDEAIKQIAREQEALRTKFKYINDELIQVVEADLNSKIKKIDLSNICKECIDDELKKVLKEESYKPFDLENGPLVRFTLIKVGKEETIFMMVIHHIIFDGWSMGLFYKNLSEKYNNLINGIEYSKKRKMIQYADYSAWQKEEINKSKMENQFKYWNNKLKNIEQNVEFPADKKRPSVMTINGDVVFFELENELVKKLREYSIQSKSTVNTILLSVFKCLVYKYTKQNNITVGTAVANRKISGIENIMGFFVNTIVLNTEIEGKMEFSNFLNKVKMTTLEACDNEEFPFDQLVEKINPSRDSSRNPFFQLMFTYQNISNSSVGLKNLTIEEYALGSKRSAVDITLSIEERENGISGVFEYNTDLFYKETIERICNQFKLILKQIIHNDKIEIRNISIIDMHEKNLILKEFNNTRVDYDKQKTVVDLFEEQVDKTPDEIAIIFENEKLTYNELNQKANAIAFKLRNLGVLNDEFVGIITERSLEMVIAILGTIKAGGAYVPIDPSYPKERINYIISDCRPKAILKYTESNEFNEISAIDLKEKNIFNSNLANLEKINTPEDILCLIYTSGTTGKPKGVMTKHSNMVNYCSNNQYSALKGVLDRKLNNIGSVTNMTFDIFGTEILWVFANGKKSIIANFDEQRDVNFLNKFIKRNDIEVLQTTPSRIKILLSKVEELKKLDSLKYIILCGEKVEYDVISKLQKYSNAVIENAYGPSETTIFSTANELTENIENNNISIGKPIANTQIYILDNSNICGIGVPGELCIAGDGVARGYLNNQELTNEKFIKNKFGAGNLYKTGDLARWLPNGDIEYLGRIDEQVKIRGFRVELGEIASVLLEINCIKNAAVIARDDSKGEKAIYAYVVSDYPVNIRDIKTILRKELPDYMMPSYMMQIEEIPVNTNGKLDKKSLPHILQKESKELVLAKNETEQKIVDIFKEVLDCENVSIDDDFFEIGGHSLRATKVTNRIEVDMGVRIPLKTIFLERTPQGIAKYIDIADKKQYDFIGKSIEKEYYPMSSVQKRIYLLWQMEKESIAYNMPSYYKLKGNVKVNNIKNVLQELINRHEILRTSFIIRKGELVQKIVKSLNVDFSYEESNDEINEILKRFNKPFNLEMANLVRTKVVKRKNEYYLLIDMHHIVSDGMSIGIFTNEFSDLYNGKKLVDSNLQYKDYSEWINTRDLKAQKKYWVGKFDDEIPVINLPYDFTRPAEQSYDGSTINIKLENEVKKGIKNLCEQIKVTEYMFLLGAFMVTLNKYTGQDDIIVGTPISGRINKDMESMMGMFVNTLAVRENIRSDISFIDFMDGIKENCLKMYENQEYPFEELVESINIKRDFSRNPLFDVMFGMQNNEISTLRMDELVVEQIWGESTISKFDLSIMIQSIDDEYFVGAEYCTAIFKCETINRFLLHFKEIIKKLMKNPEVCIGEIGIITKEEIDILDKFNNTELDYNKDKKVVEAFENKVREIPDKIALVFEGEKITYRELNQKANCLARVLRKRGVQTDVVVGMMSDRSIEMIIGIIAILKAGGAYLPIDKSYPKERIEFILNNSLAKVLLTQKNLFEEFKYNGDILYLDRDDLYKGNNSNLSTVGTPEDLIYIIYTSGTTGEPKGVMFKNNSLYNLINFQIEKTNINLKTKVLQFANLSFDVASQEILSTLLAGGELYLIKDEMRKEVLDLLSFIEINKIETVFFPTAYFKLLQSEKKYIEKMVKNVKDVIVAGEQLILTEEVQFLIRNSNINIHNHYGPSETHVVTTNTINSEGNIKNIPTIGKPIANNKIYILDKMMNLCPINVQGEMYISGDNVARGYLNNEDLSRTRFISNPYNLNQKMYKTGDLARWLPDGNIEYLGRIDEQVKIRGFRIELGEVANALVKLDEIKEVAVIVKSDINNENLIYAYVVSDKEIDHKIIRRKIRNELPEYMIPSYILQIDKIPLNKNGKVDKRNLPDITDQNLNEYLEASTDNEKIIVKIFEKVIGRNKISVDDDFFAVGGHSLRATKVVNEIESEIGKRIPIKAIFSQRTAQAIAKYIDEEVNEIYEYIPKSQTKEFYSMSSAQRRMYLIWEMNKTSLVYNMPVCYKLDGLINKKKIKSTLQKILNRHQILRTCFIMQDGELLQKVIDNMTCDYSYERDDINTVDYICEKFTKPFALDKGNLIRIKLVEQKDYHYLLLDMHHIVSDGISMGIFINEFSAIYNGKKLEELDLQYKDYSEWMRKKDIKIQKEYWVNQFEEEAPIIDLPYDYNRPLEKSYNGAIKTIALDDEIKNKINDLGKITGATEYMIFLAAFMVLLNKYTRQKDIVIGTPISGRTNKATENMMGMFINTLAIRQKVDEKKDFINFVNEVKENCLKAYENQEFPFEELVESVKINRDFSRNPLFDVMFSLRNTENFNLSMDDIKIDALWGEYKISKFDLSVTIGMEKDKHLICAEYCTELFKAETIDRFLIHFKEAIYRLICRPKYEIGKLNFITNKEKSLILNTFNDSNKEYNKEKNLVDIFEKRVRSIPNNIAVVYDNEKITYKQLNEKANSLANILREQGVRADTVVGIILERSVKMIISMIAILKAGAAYLPIDPNHPKNRIEYMLRDSNVNIILSTKKIKREISFTGDIIDISDQRVFNENIENLNIISDTNDLAYVIYTSGTTGNPKGVMIERKSVVNLVDSLQDHIYKKYEGYLRVALVANYVFDASVQQIFACLLLGHSLYIVDDNSRMQGDALVQFYLDKKIELTDGTPIHLSMMANSKLLENNNLKLKHMIIGGDKLLKDTVQRIYDKLKINNVTITNVYGPTECCVDSSYQDINKNNIGEFDNIPIGKPLNNYNIYILDKHHNIMPIGIAGELYISGNGLARGYLNNKNLTNKNFINNPFKINQKMYRSGDLAKWRVDGSIEYLGRVDEQVKIRGFRIELGEILNELRKIKYIDDAAVIVKKDKTGEDSIYGYIISKEKIVNKKVKKELKEILPEYMIPSYIMQIDKIPVNRSGKLDKQALPDIMEENIEKYNTPRNQMQKDVLEIFKEVTGRGKISIDDDFFEIGGHSLRATKVVNRIESKLGIRIPIKIIFSRRTVEGIAEYIENNKEQICDFIPKANVKDFYNMSSAQKRMYSIWQMDKESIVYNMPGFYKLNGEVNKKAIKDALQKIIKRHEILRTSFMIKNDKYVQKILNTVQFEYSYEKYEKEIAGGFEGFIKPFNLNKGELIRCKLINCENQNYLFIDMHHIVSDGMSSGIFIKEFSLLYNGNKLKENKLQYKDYSEWINNKNLDLQKQYWINQFKDEIVSVDLPYDYNRPVEKSYDGAMTSIKFEEELKQGIQKLCKITGATEYMVLLGIFMVTISKYARQEEIIIGTPISGRTNKDMENMMGVFINTLAIKEKVDAKNNFIDLIEKLKETCLKAYENQEYPFEELVECININRDISRNPLFDITFGLQNNEKFDLEMDQLKIENIWGEHKISKFDLSVLIEERKGTYFVLAEYCTALFKKESIDNFLMHYKEIICKIILNPNMPIEMINGITNVEEDLILNKFNKTNLEYDKNKTVVDIFQQQVNNSPNAIALVFGEEKLTYRELDLKANNVAAKLRKMGIQRDEFVIVIAKRSLEMIIGILGVIKAGAAYVPIDPDYPGERIQYILSDCKPKAIIKYKANINYEKVPIIDLENGDIFKEKILTLKKINKVSDLLYVIYTSGTTGKPKGVMIEHAGVNNLREYFINTLKVTSNDRILQFSNIAFDGSVWDITMSLFTGASLYIIDQEKLLDLEYMSQYANKTTIMALPPQYYQQLKNKGQRLVITAGSESSEAIITKAINEGINYLNSYGPTEATVCATQWTYEKDNSRLNKIPIGRPIDNKKIYICDESGLCPIGMPGELCIAGDGIARGYLNKKELTKQKFIENPYGSGRLYKTGDLARWLDDGNIEYLGRIDEQVKIRGFRVELEEIASIMRKLNNIDDIAIIAKDDKKGQKAIYAYVVSNKNIEFRELKKEMRKELPEYMIPAYMMQINQIPVTRNGKLDKNKLPDIVNEEVRVYTAPRNKKEKYVVNLFKEIIGIENVSIDDDFFELGGHSLRATKLVNMIESKLGVRVPIKIIFSERTVMDIVKYIEKQESIDCEYIFKAENKNYYDMSAAQKRMYLIWEIDKESIAYNMPLCYKIDGKIVLENIKIALQKLIERHEIFRTSFKMKDGKAIQEIIDSINIDYSYEECNSNIEDIINEFIKPFNLEKAELVRMKVVKSKDEYYLLIDMHHIVSDGVSINIFINEFSKLYNQKELNSIKLQYKDYSEWLKFRDLEDQKKYWINQFNDEIPIIDFPYDYKRPVEQSHDGNITSLSFDQKLKNKIATLCKITGATEYMVLLAGFMITLNKYTQQEDIIVGTPISGRINSDVESIMGVFINTLAIRQKPEAQKSFINFIDEVKENCIKAYENQEYSFEELIEAIDIKRDFSRNPLFDMTFGMQNYENANVEIDGINLDLINIEHKTSKFDLSVVVQNNKNGYDIVAEYCTALFKEKTINRFLIHYKEIMNQVIENPNILISDIKALTTNERDLILSKFNDTYLKYDKEKTVVQLIEEQVKNSWNKKAIVYEKESLTYEELDKKATILAIKLRDLGIKPNQCVAIVSDRSLEMVIGILAIIKSGAGYVPIDSKNPTERIKYILSDCNAKILLSYGVTLKGIEIPVIDLKDSSSFEGELRALENVNTADDLLYVIYTSGTTGNPKGVMVKNKNMINYCLKSEKSVMSAMFTMNLNNIGAVTSISFDIFATEILFIFIYGMTTFIANNEEQEDVFHLNNFIKRNNVEILQTTPSRVKILLSQPEEFKSLKSLKYIIVGGEVLERELVDKVYKYTDIIMKNGYGPSETTIASTCIELSRENKEEISIGRPIMNTQIYILQGLNLCGVGVPGELCIAGDGVSSGYINNKSLTEEKFIENPYGDGKLYRTGDLAKWCDDGNIKYLGRIDEQVKIRGFRIELGEIANSLFKIKGIEDTAVIVNQDSNGDMAIYAYIVSNEDINLRDLRKELKNDLPYYMIPSYMMQIEKIPTTRNGKLDKSKLPNIEKESKEEYIAARNQVEIDLASIWEEVLGIESIGINDDFFELGGDSIKLIQVIARAKLKGYYFNVKDLFGNSTISELSRNIKYNTFEINQDEVIGEVDLTPIQKWFFEMRFEEENHWNQSVILFNKKGFVEGFVKKSFDYIVKHHDALRMVYIRENGYVKQINRSTSEKLYDFDIYDCRGIECVDENYIEKKSNEIQRSIDLRKGPLVKIALFKTVDGDHLLIVMHHLIIDGVSWRIIYEDLEKVYSMLENGESVKLPEKTTSFKEWSSKQNEYANKDTIKKQLMYWEKIEKENIEQLPKDKYAQKSKFADIKNVGLELSEQQTEKLLKDINKVYNTEINDVLLAALALTISNWTGKEKTLINLESHGREEIIENVDITRTIGWFTSQYPVVLNNEDNNIAMVVKNTKDILRRVPNKGIDYGIIKYLSKDKFNMNLVPEISFNYLGQFDQDVKNNLFVPSNLNMGESISLNNKILYSINFSIMLIDDKLKIDIMYNDLEYNKNTMQMLINSYKDNLIKVINHCITRVRREKTASDITKQNITLEQLKPYINEIDNIKSIYPLTPMQEGMLYHTLANENTEVYHEVINLKIKGNLDANILEQSFNKLILRHDILRTIFDNKNFNKNMQIVFNKRKTKIKYYDDMKNKKINIEEYINNIILEDKKNKFNLSKDVLIRITLLKIEKDVYQLILSNHHIILDGWCSSLLMFELFKIYDGLKYNYVPKLKESVAYSNYIDWLDSKNEKDAEKYWENYLLEFDTITEIPFKESVENQNYKNSEMYFNFEKDITKKLEIIAKTNKVTVNTIIQSVWSILLQKYNNSNDIIFGYVVSGRNPEVKGIESMMGLFINTIPLRVKIEKNTSFKQMLLNINKSFIESSEYDFYPLAQIQNLSEVKDKLINNIMIFENYPVDNEGLNDNILAKNDLEIVDVKAVEQTNYDFNLIVSYQEIISIKFQFNELVYSKINVEKIKNNFIILISEIIKNENILINDLSLLSTNEKSQVLFDFNKTQINYPKEKTIKYLFEKKVEEIPERIALVFEEEKLSYKELNNRANVLAWRLREFGVKANDFVAISAQRSLEMVIGILAIVKAGAAYVPIDPKYPVERKEYIISDCNPKVILTYQTEFISSERLVIDIEEFKNSNEVFNNLDTICKADDLLYLIYTSGTTGKPKGVMITNKNVINYCLNNEKNVLNEAINSRLTNMAALTNMTFDIFVTEIFLAFLNGMTSFIANSNEQEIADDLNSFINKNNIEIIQSTPSRIKILLSQEKKLETVKYILVGGEKLEYELVRKLHQFTTAVIKNVYGPSETTVWSTFSTISRDLESTNISIGKPIANTQIYILQGFNICGVGIRGELCIAGNGVAKGYLNRDDLTSEKFIENPFGEGKLYRTGDLAKWLPNGDLEYLGRVDEQVKIRGYRIELSEIESVLNELDDVKDSVVIARENKFGEKAIYSYVISDKNLDFKLIREDISKKLPIYMIPAYMMQIESIPLNGSGKLNKRELPEIIEVWDVDYIEPTNQKEKMICDIFKEVLEIEKVGVQNNFFELGGDSIKLLRLIALLRKKGFNVTFNNIRESKNIKILSDSLTQKKGVNLIEKTKNNVVVNRIIAPINNVDNFFETKLYKELNKYNANLDNANIDKEYKPLEIQNDFLNREKAFISSLGIEIIGEISKEEILNAIKDMINKQAILRTIYNIDKEYLTEMNLDEVYIPYFDKSEYDQISRVLGGIFKCEEIFKTNELLSKIIVVEKQNNHHLIYFYVNHAVWDFMTSEIVIDMFKKKFRNEKKSFIAEETYYEYIDRKRHKSKNVNLYDSIENIEKIVEKYKTSLKENYKYSYKIRVTKAISEVERKEILKNSMNWILNKYYSILNIKEIKNIPFTIVHHSREVKTLSTLGLYADTIPCLYSIDEEKVYGFNVEEINRKTLNESYQLYKESIPSTSNIFKELNINITMTDNNYTNFLANQVIVDKRYLINEIDEEIHMNIDKNMVTVFCQIHSAEKMEKDLIIDKVKRSFDIE